MKTVFVLFAFVIAFSAQAQQVMPLYDGKAPGSLSNLNNERSVKPAKARPAMTWQTKQAKAPPFYNDILAFKEQDAAQPPANNGILLVGSSSFTRWKDVNDYFPGYPIINRGFGGATLVDVIRYAYDVILPYKPKQVLIYCGENDLASGDNVTADMVLLRLKTLFGIIRTNLPNTMISFVSIKPSPVRAHIQPKVKVANKEIRSFLRTQKNAQFINIYDAMLDTGKQMREELYVGDRLHMKPEGYAIWKKIIVPYLIK